MGGTSVRAASSLLFHQPDSIYLRFGKVTGSAGTGQVSLESGVYFNDPGLGTETGHSPAQHQKTRS